jgi:hypothetical protein
MATGKEDLMVYSMTVFSIIVGLLLSADKGEAL